MAAGSESLCSTLLFVGLFVFVSADQETITAESGQNVTLTCRAPNHSIDIVEWSRADLKSQHVFVCWDGQVLPEEQHPSFKNRVDLQDRQMKDGDVSVSLKNVTFSDTGTYECRVQREDDSVELIITITLSVAPPPGPTGGTTEDGGSVGLIIGLSVAAVLLVAAVGFVIYRKHEGQQSQGSYHPPAEQHSV
ncbi:coxsackievirus and adenovirus receptor-like [Archocentrus centrarchus]|uniref:coxsackievirus and adenovirus receptor-like n=1 Tax=Archocentrus centrarchus TaxID=63155 RepID=UPI0011EA088C|nr:coxsackievirus and adenovirus receptor-like [Archocentrus centrarchus]